MTAPVLRDATEVSEVARRVAAELKPGAAERDRTGAVPHEAMALVDGSGLLGITVPESAGGPGLGPVALADTIRILAAADPAVTQCVQGHFVIVDAVTILGTEDQKARWHHDTLAGRRVAAPLAERGAQHAQDLRTRLSPTGDGWSLAGTKAYSTGAITAAAVAINALDPDGALVLALVPAGSAGLSFDEDWYAMGQRATVSGTTTLVDVAVGADDLMPWGTLFAGPQVLGARAQLVHAAIEVGIARGALDDGAEYLRTSARPFFEVVRSGLAERASQDPLVRVRLGRLETKVRAAEALLHRAATDVEQIGLAPWSEQVAAEGSLAVAAAKAFGSEVAVEVTTEIFALGGASSTDRRRGLDRHWRNARTHSVHDPIDWKYHHLGAFVADGTLPPNHGQI